jgi:hypothetical protein
VTHAKVGICEDSSRETFAAAVALLVMLTGSVMTPEPRITTFAVVGGLIGIAAHKATG